MPAKLIEETQKTLLYQSLIKSDSVRPKFLQDYDRELTMTTAYLSDRGQYRKSIFEYTEDVQRAIAKKIEDDDEDTFNVI
jgi:hypothetical protein